MTDTTGDAEPLPLTPWAAEGRWPTASELLGWLAGDDHREGALAVLGAFIADAQRGQSCDVAHHRNHIAELQALNNDTYLGLCNARAQRSATAAALQVVRKELSELRAALHTLIGD